MVIDQQLTQLRDTGDYRGIGNLMIEVLTRLPDQERRPDRGALLLARRIRELVSAKFGIPPALTYADVYRDKHLAASDRGRWDRDTFVQLLIYAYVFGGTRENLPPPHEKLLAYYKKTARDQEQLIREVATEYSKRAPDRNQLRRAQEIEEQIRRVQQSGQPQHLIDEEVAALREVLNGCGRLSYRLAAPNTDLI